jgi:hypothetical protein
MKTAVEVMIQWCLSNGFNVEDQAGVMCFAIDILKFREQFDKFLDLERQQLEKAYYEGNFDGRKDYDDDPKEYLMATYERFKEDKE